MNALTDFLSQAWVMVVMGLALLASAFLLVGLIVLIVRSSARPSRRTARRDRDDDEDDDRPLARAHRVR